MVTLLYTINTVSHLIRASAFETSCSNRWNDIYAVTRRDKYLMLYIVPTRQRELNRIIEGFNWISCNLTRIPDCDRPGRVLQNIYAVMGLY